MASISKRVSGSWVSGDERVMKTATDTITTLPADLYADGTNATVGLKGNMSQLGTPTPTTPIYPSECGERTENLFPLDESRLHVGRIENDGTIDYEIGTLTVETDSVTYEANAMWRGFYTDFIQVNENEQLTFSPNDSSSISWSCACYDENGNFLGKASAQSTTSTRTFNLLSGTKKVRMSVTSSNTTYTILRPMLNTGSTALPYEPYGYKIPISSANTTTPVYLGEVQSTRRIKKLVLTGEENWIYSTSSQTHWIENVPNDYDNTLMDTITTVCTHYRCIYNSTGFGNMTNGDLRLYAKDTSPIAHELYIKDTTYTSATDFKTYLQQQYAAGTPVTIWYVLATEETGIINEPIRKIGDYADEVLGITIPTIAGADTLSVDTTLQPSEVSATYHGWHKGTVHERESGAWD